MDTQFMPAPAPKEVAIVAHKTDGHHGTSRAIAEIIREEGFKISLNKQRPPWYGTGAYFFDTMDPNSQQNAMNWAQKEFSTLAVVLRAHINSPRHLDLRDPKSAGARYFEHMKREAEKAIWLSSVSLEEVYQEFLTRRDGRPQHSLLEQLISHLTCNFMTRTFHPLTSIGYHHVFQKSPYSGIVVFDKKILNDVRLIPI